MRNTIIKLESEITTDFIKEISQRLSEGLQIRRTLPENGRIHIDRKIPFLTVYRRPQTRADEGTDRLIQGEASYLVATSSPKQKAGISSLVSAVVKTLSKGPGIFLIIEIWTRESPIQIIDPETGRAAPSFRIFVPPDRIPTETIESLKKALTRITVSKNKGEVTTVFQSRPWPAELPSLISTTEIKKYNCFLIGLEVSPIFRNPDTNELYPLVLRKMHRGLSRAIKLGTFTFLKKHSKIRPASYKSLGRRAVVKAVWEVDHKLAKISNELEFLLLITPINIEQSWYKFKSCKCDCEPVFYYRPIPVDPSVLKRKLYQIPFDKIEDPTLASIFHEKLVELEMKFSMLRDRNTKNFFYGSMQLFGELDDDLISMAEHILNKISPKSHEFSGSRKVNAASFAERAREEIKFYQKVSPDINSKVIIRDDITGLMVSNGNLLIGKQVKIPESRVEALIQHEVGTHVLTYLNGLDQPFQQLYCGLADSDELQEGLAVFSEYLVGGLSPPRLRLLAGRVIAAQLLIDGASFIDTFRELNDNRGFAMRTAYTITSRIYRGGGFTKDAIYLRGLMNLVKYLRDGGELAPLLIGKISTEDIPVISELQFRKVLKPSLLKPRYFDSSKSMTKLSEIKQGKKIFKLI
ncbi:flavohemoglobin expression-modulating QEGLA motif protein [Bacteroidota bacterium]